MSFNELLRRVAVLAGDIGHAHLEDAEKTALLLVGIELFNRVRTSLPGADEAEEGEAGG